MGDDSDGTRAEFLKNLEFETLRGIIHNKFSEAGYRLCEQTLGLAQPNLNFRNDIVEAVLLAGLFHHLRPKRASVVRRESKLVEKLATAAVTTLRQLSEAVDQATLKLPEPLSALTTPIVLEGLHKYALAVGRAADALKDKGGVSKRLWGFEFFIRELAKIFLHVTKAQAGLTWNAHQERYAGRFWTFEEYVLAIAAAEIAGPGFAPFKPLARGREIQRILTAMDKTQVGQR